MAETGTVQRNAADEATLPAAKKRRRIKFFRGSEAVPHNEVVEYGDLSDADAAGLKTLAEAGFKDGVEVVCVFRDPDPGGMSVCLGWFKSGFPVVRHSHDSDCLYYIVGGEIRMGSTVLGVGDGVLIPANHPYSFEPGPEGVHLIEFRNTNRTDIRLAEHDPSRWLQLAEQVKTRRGFWQAERTPPSGHIHRA
jgi:hypothetical protein